MKKVSKKEIIKYIKTETKEDILMDFIVYKNETNYYSMLDIYYSRENALKVLTDLKYNGYVLKREENEG